MLGVAAALEAWLLKRSRERQTLRLARAVAWFGCGVQERNLCGRSRPVCPYLHLSPERGGDRKRLATLRRIGQDRPWRCSEWHRVMDWYDARSDAAHGDFSSVTRKAADDAEFWVAHYLMVPIVEWLSANSNDPVTALDQQFAAVTDPQGWDAMLGALDSPSPPAAPPTLL